MSLLVVGSVALDTIETPFGKVERALGGSATFISIAASYFIQPVRLVGVVGRDFPPENLELLDTLKYINILVINDSESRELSREANLIKAAKKIQEFGPKIVIIKKGEHCVLMFKEDKIFSAPAYPLESIYDPTDAGDSFAGGFMGYLAKT